MNDSEKLAIIGRIYDIQYENNEAEEGDKFLADSNLALEAVGHALNGDPEDVAWLVRNHYIDEVS